MTTFFVFVATAQFMSFALIYYVLIFYFQFKGFPRMIETRDQLIDMVKRILFIPIQHSAINYPVSYYGAFTPNMPTKLYDPKTQDFTIDNLPQYNIASVS